MTSFQILDKELEQPDPSSIAEKTPIENISLEHSEPEQNDVQMVDIGNLVVNENENATNVAGSSKTSIAVQDEIAISDLIQNEPKPSEKPDEPEKVDNQAKNDRAESESSTNESIDVFDLLKENEELFAKADSNQALDDIDDLVQIENIEPSTSDPEPPVNRNIIDEELLSDELMPDIEHLEGSEKSSEIESARLTEEDDITYLGKECINLDCEKKSKVFYEAPEFAMSHYHSKNLRKISFVCTVCFKECVEKYGELIGALEDAQPLYLKVSRANMSLIIIHQLLNNFKQTKNIFF